MTLASRVQSWAVFVVSIAVITIGFGLIVEKNNPRTIRCEVIFDGLVEQASERMGDRLPNNLEEEVELIAETVAAIRGLDFTEVPKPTFLSPAELSQRVHSQVTEEYPDEQAVLDGRLLAALGAAPRDIDMKQLIGSAYSGAVGGYYDDRTGEIVVGSRNPGEVLSPEDRVTLAHELTHALTDQTLGLPDHGPDPKPEEDDKHFAGQALIEGDATLVGYVYGLAALGDEDPTALLGGGEASEETLVSIPHYLERSIVFPYVEGAEFICHLYAKGGWDAVNRAYSDLPKSTAAILFPATHSPVTAPAKVSTPGSLAEPWQFKETRVFGAVDVLWLFEAPGGDTSKEVGNPFEHARDWAGGTFSTWTREDKVALGVSLEEKPNGNEMCDGMSTWYERSFDDDAPAERLEGENLAVSGPVQSAVLRCRGGSILMGIGPDLETARALAAGG
ncbi:MAG: hypothetical protein KY429_01775 [Actinobacteria bacterium]|nr:hypothetical protein [Actinomycetota bacterium]